MKQIILVPAFVLIYACGDTGESVDEQTSTLPSPAIIDEYKQPAPSTKYAEAQAAAVAAIEISVSRGHAWSTAEVLLEEAAVVAASGNYELAIQLADKARIQADLSIRQADLEERAWKNRVLSN